VAACAFALTFAVGAPASSTTTHSIADRSAPTLRDPTRTAKALVTRFVTLIQHQDVKGLRHFLSPAFQIERADGSGSGKAEYLTMLPTVQSFELTDLSASQSGSVLVVRFLASTTGVVNGKPFTPGPAPRLAVFAWNGSAWQLIAYANFNPLSG
jgi:hypothetical protein